MPEIYRSQHAATIADLMRQQGAVSARSAMAQGNAEAERAAASGQIWGQAIQNIGQGVSGTLRDFAQAREQAPMQALRQRQADQLALELSRMEAAAAAKRVGELASMVKASGYDPSTAEPVFRAIGKLSPDYEQPLMRSLMEPALLKSVTDTLISQTPGYKPPEGFTLGEGQTRFGPGGEQLANVPKPAPVEQPFTLGEGQVRYGPGGEPIASGPPKPETLVNVQRVEVLLDGKPAFAVFNPRTEKFSVNGQDVTARVKPIPPREPQGPAQRFIPKMITAGGETMLANYDAQSGHYFHPDTGARLQNVGEPPTADMRNKEVARGLVGKSIEPIKTLSQKILTKVGPAQRAEAIKRGAEAVFGTDPEFRTYQDARMALAGNLAVAQQGSRPSDADIRAIWLPLIPDAYRDTSESAAMKWDLIETMSGTKKTDALPGDIEYDMNGNPILKKGKP